LAPTAITTYENVSAAYMGLVLEQLAGLGLAFVVGLALYATTDRQEDGSPWTKAIAVTCGALTVAYLGYVASSLVRRAVARERAGLVVGTVVESRPLPTGRPRPRARVEFAALGGDWSFVEPVFNASPVGQKVTVRYDVSEDGRRVVAARIDGEDGFELLEWVQAAAAVGLLVEAVRRWRRRPAPVA
jgi:hypothetical protein